MTMRLDRLVRQFAESNPDQLAVDGKTETLTYRELDALASQFARLFRRMGIAPGDRVGIHLPRSGRGIAAMLGAMRAHAAYVPLDPGSPPARVALIAQNCGLRHVVISPQLLGAWLSANVSTPVTDFVLSADGPVASSSGIRVHPWSSVTAETSGAPDWEPREDPRDLAYVLYTSGSTGTPKGVMLSHENGMAFVDWAAQAITLTCLDRVASVAPFHFDLSVFDVWASLSRGATIVIVDETTVISGSRMLERIRRAAITVWYSVPSALILMLDQGDLEANPPPSLRAVYFAGEVFPMKHLRRAMRALPHARFFNLFGPTETNVCLAYALPSIPDERVDTIPIGVPVAGDRALILDAHGVPVEDGEMGELFIDGPTVMLGYWNGGDPLWAKRPYPTGDLVTRRPDGQIMYHGRRDHMVKVRGYRVELGEVEAILHAHPGVQEGIVFAADQELVAVLVASDPQLSVLGIKQHCAARLPRYMIPSDIRLVPSLPRTSSGKIDRVSVKNAVLSRDAASSETRKELQWKRA